MSSLVARGAEVLGWVWQHLAAVILPVLALGLMIPSASAQITLPDPGVDVAGHVTAAITAMGGILLVVVGGFFAFLLIRKGISWARRALG